MRGIANAAIVVLALVGMLLVGGILWAIVGPKMTPKPTPTPKETVAETTPTPPPAPSPEGTPVPVGKMTGRWTDAIDPDVVLVLESEGRSLKILEPATLAGTFAPAGRRYTETGKGRSLELTDAGELVLTTEKGKGEDWDTKLFNRASADNTPTPTPEETATPTPEPTVIEETPTPVETAAEQPSPVALPTPSPAGETGSPEAFLQQYYEAINTDRFQEAYELRSLRSRKSTTYPEFIHIWSNNRSIQLLDATVLSNDGAVAELEIHLRADDISRTTHKSTITNYTAKVKLVLEDEKWCYDGGDFKAETQ